MCVNLPVSDQFNKTNTLKEAVHRALTVRRDKMLGLFELFIWFIYSAFTNCVPPSRHESIRHSSLSFLSFRCPDVPLKGLQYTHTMERVTEQHFKNRRKSRPYAAFHSSFRAQQACLVNWIMGLPSTRGNHAIGWSTVYTDRPKRIQRERGRLKGRRAGSPPLGKPSKRQTDR